MSSLLETFARLSPARAPRSRTGSAGRRLVVHCYACVALGLAWSAGAQAQVTVFLTNGMTVVGERIAPDGPFIYKLEFYRGLSRQIPQAWVKQIEPLPEPKGGPPRATARAPKDALSDAEKAELDQLLVSYFDAAAKPEERAKILADLRARDTLPAGDVAEIGRRIRELAWKGPKLTVGTARFEHPRFKGEVHVEVEPKNQPPGKGLPVFLALHGGGEGDAHWNSGTGMFTGPALKTWKRGIFICPTAMAARYAEWGRNPAEGEYLQEVMRAAKRTWDIDTDQVYVGGHSMGGYGTWHIAGQQADVFAGAVAASGGILTGDSIREAWGWGVISNLRHTPISFIHGTADGPSPVWSDQAADRLLNGLGRSYPSNYVHRYVEIPKGDHMASAAKIAEEMKWVLQFKRDPNPKGLMWEPLRSYVKHFYWLYVEKPELFQRIVARIDGNEIELTTTRLNRGFSVLLNSRLVDLTQPVTVRINSEEAFRGLVQPSITALLQSIADKLDDKLVYTARIDF